MPQLSMEMLAKNAAIACRILEPGFLVPGTQQRQKEETQAVGARYIRVLEVQLLPNRVNL